MKNRKKTDTEYQSEHHKLIATKPEALLLAIEPLDAKDARAFLAAANQLDASTRIKEHFAEYAKQP